MRRAIRLGDPTRHGGRVVSAANFYRVMDIPVARAAHPARPTREFL